MPTYFQTCVRTLLPLFIFLVSSLFFLVALPAQAEAAALYFGPTSGSYEVGEQFSVNVFVSSNGDELNAVKAEVAVSNSNAELISVSQAGSIIDFWAVDPTVSGGGRSAKFEGVTLGSGYRGNAGSVVTLVFRGRSSGKVDLSFAEGIVLANDGNGTALPVTTGTASFSIVEGKTAPFDASQCSVFNKDLERGDSNADVGCLQVCLIDQGLYDGDITSFFGDGTEEAVIVFQEKYAADILEPQGFTEGTGQVAKGTRDKLNKLCFQSELPAQLFDIELTIDEPQVVEAHELAARVTFTSFGTEETPVDLTFTIVDARGETLIEFKDTTAVETEKVFRKYFPYLYLPEGDYTLKLTTLYNEEVEDIFTAPFTVTGAPKAVIDYSMLLLALIALGVLISLLLLFVIILLLRRMPEHIEKEHRILEQKEYETLTKAKKHLMTSKTKIDNDLKRINARLLKLSPEENTVQTKSTKTKSVPSTKRVAAEKKVKQQRAKKVNTTN